MSTINERIAAVVADSGLTKLAFGQRINVSSAFMSQICGGTRSPSDRTILDICREFRVDEVWLRTGAGEMHRPMSRREEINSYLSEILGGLRSPAEEAFIAAMARLPSEYWPMLERALDTLCTEYLTIKSEKEDKG